MTDQTHNPPDLSMAEQRELLVGLLTQEAKRVFPLSLAQQRLWFLDQLHPGNPACNVPFGLRLRGYLIPGALELSVRRLIQRHEILRTRFETESGHPVQAVAEESVIKIPFIDLVGMLTSDRHWE